MQVFFYYYSKIEECFFIRRSECRRLAGRPDNKSSLAAAPGLNFKNCSALYCSRFSATVQPSRPGLSDPLLPH